MRGLGARWATALAGAVLATAACGAPAREGGEGDGPRPGVPPEERSQAEVADATRSLGCSESTRRAMASGPSEQVPTGPEARPEVVTARPVGAFLDSVGVNIHMTYTDTPYADHDRLLEVLEETGIRHVRDALVPGREEEQAGFLRRLAAQGGCAQLIVGGGNVDAEELSESVGLAREAVDVLAGVEGPNELDLYDPDDWVDVATDQQEALAEAFREDPELAAVPVAGLSVGRIRAFSRPGDLSEELDLANLHPYPGGDPPEGEIEPHREAARELAGDAPVLVTETGYHDALEDESSQPGVPEEVEAVYLPRLLLDAFDIGVTRTYLYELLDEFPDDDDDQASFGLYRRDWSPKPAAHSVVGLLDLLGRQPSSGPRDLELAVRTDGEVEDLRSVLFADDEGFWLALWRATSIYDYEDDEEIDVDPLPVTVVLQQEVDAELYRPVRGLAPEWSDSDIAQVEVDVPAEPVLLRLQP